MNWHLAIETSGREGSLALMKGQQVAHVINLPSNTRTTASFAPALESLLGQIPASDPPLGLVSISVGPGSFTGLRIGITAAKTLCFAMNCDLIAVDSLAIICQQERQRIQQLSGAGEPPHGKIAVCTNAYRGQVFLRIEPFVAKASQTLEPSKIVDQSVWEHILSEHEDRYSIRRGRDPSHGENDRTGDRSADGWPRPRAEVLGKLAWNLYQDGHRDDFWKLEPRYLRASAAEEKADSSTRSNS